MRVFTISHKKVFNQQKLLKGEKKLSNIDDNITERRSFCHLCAPLLLESKLTSESQYTNIKTVSSFNITWARVNQN